MYVHGFFLYISTPIICAMQKGMYEAPFQITSWFWAFASVDSGFAAPFLGGSPYPPPPPAAVLAVYP